jgi:hypothetical protein
MKPKYFIVLGAMIVGTASLACSLLATPVAPQVATQPLVQVEPTIPPATEPQPQPVTVSNMPNGLATAKDNLLTFYDQNGTQVSQVALPQQTFPGQDRIHLAGTMPASGGAVPLLYFSFENEEALHFRDGDGQIFSLMNGTSFLGLTGVPGQPLVAFSQVEFLEPNLRSKIYAGSVQSLSSAAPVSVIDDPESWAIKPVLVEAENGTPTQVWYTRMAYGIGGDIVFEPRKGLFVLDLATGQETTVLDNDSSPLAISNDRGWVVYATPHLPPNSICTKNLGTGAEVCFLALSAGEPRGAGDAVLSPDAGYVAWMEGDGWQMAEVPSFTATVRVGQNNGEILADLPMSSFEDAAGVGAVSRAEPVAWLDNETVIVQVRGQEWSQVAQLRYNVRSQEISYLAPGEFVGLLYP